MEPYLFFSSTAHPAPFSMPDVKQVLKDYKVQKSENENIKATNYLIINAVLVSYLLIIILIVLILYQTVLNIL